MARPTIKTESPQQVLEQQQIQQVQQQQVQQVQQIQEVDQSQLELQVVQQQVAGTPVQANGVKKDGKESECTE